MANPRRRRRKRRYRRNPHPAFNMPRRRRRRYYRARRRKGYRRNPPPAQSIFNELGYAATGFVATKFVGNMVSPMLGMGNGGPILRIGSKLGIAYLTAWGLENFLGRRAFMPTMLGGSIEAIQDFIRTFVSPFVPALAAYEYPLEIYYEGAGGVPAIVNGRVCPPGAEAEAVEANIVGQYYPGYRSSYGANAYDMM